MNNTQKFELQNAVDIIQGELDECIPSNTCILIDIPVATTVLSAAKQLPKVEKERDEAVDAADLMCDEFQRIRALVNRDSEIIGLCDRAISKIRQNVPVIVQRENAEYQLSQLRADFERAVESLNRLWQEDEMGWIIFKGEQGEVYYECTKCGKYSHVKLDIEHDGGCVQGYIHEALSTLSAMEYLKRKSS